ncbi:hypothetical protein BHM03_00005481 [Ensete ventricosum]|nr:hypothetical protein BHM03_00005481 [Ensete ventricosum]
MGCCRNDSAEEALVLFDEMLKKGLEITDRTVVALISACFQMGNLALGSRTHAYVYKTVTHHEDCVFIGTGLMDMYSKCRCLASALKVFDNMRDRNVLTWSKHHGSRPALWANAVAFTGLLSACCHRGLAEEGLYLFDAMKNKFGVEPSMRHYGCMVDLLGRVGMVEQAHASIRMLIEPDAIVWRDLLGACRIYKHEKLGQEIGKILLQLEKGSTSKADNCEDYVALSKMDAAAERWEDVLTLREAMKNNAVHNRPSRSAV